MQYSALSFAEMLIAIIPLLSGRSRIDRCGSPDFPSALPVFPVCAGCRAAFSNSMFTNITRYTAIWRSANLSHIRGLRLERRALTVEHREWMICLGRGFDFLHTPNLALIVGPYSPNLADPIRKAATIIESNMAAGRIPDDGFLLLASVPYDEIGVERARAVMKSRFLSGFAAEVIEREFPALAEKMIRHTSVLDWNSRRIELLPEFGGVRH